MRAKGFTLLELIMALAMSACLYTIGVMSYSYFVQRNEQRVILDELKSVIEYAKMQALILGEPVYLIPLDASLNWSKGVALNTWNRKANNMVMHYQWQWNFHRWDLVWNGAYSANKIIFSPNPVSAISNGRFSLTNQDTHKKTEIILNRLGRIRVSQS